jgi:hypothetical protein
MNKLTFALNNWTAEQRSNGYWYYGDTYRDKPEQYRGPYSSQMSVCLMIAREMTKEIARRRQRLEPSMAQSPAE